MIPERESNSPVWFRHLLLVPYAIVRGGRGHVARALGHNIAGRLGEVKDGCEGT